MIFSGGLGLNHTLCEDHDDEDDVGKEAQRQHRQLAAQQQQGAWASIGGWLPGAINA